VYFSLGPFEGRRVLIPTGNKSFRLPLEQTDRFNVFKVEYLPIARGDKLLITRNDLKKGLINGQIFTVKELNENGIIIVYGTAVLS
jgi:hypothetical protein